MHPAPSRASPLRLRLGAFAIATLLGAAACTGGSAERDVAAPGPSSPTPTRTPTPSRTPTPPTPEPHPVSLQALMTKEYDGRDLRIVDTLARSGSSTTYAIRYRGGGLRLSGLMLVPAGEGPFPVVVLNHGYIDPDVYRTGQGFERSQRYLVARGFVVVHVDYRNHAASDDDPDLDLTMRLGYAEDTINAVLAVKSSRLPYLDTERVGMIGRSMGGGVTLNALVARPDIVDAAVLFASVSSDTVDNFNKWIRPRTEVSREILARYGEPADAPAFWRDVSPRTFFDRIEVPVMVHHGTADTTCPIRWAEATVQALRAADADVIYHRYPGEGHQLYAQYARSMDRTIAFLREHLAA